MQDFDSNVFTLPPQVLSVGEYFGSGIAARFSADNFVAQVDSGPSSWSHVHQFGVSEVVFSMENR